MRLLIQRVKQGAVAVEGKEIGRIGAGLCLFLGVAREDTEKDADYLAEKTAGLRIFEDEAGKFNRSLLDVRGEVLVVSEFTLYGDSSKGKRPSFSRAAAPETAQGLYEYFVKRLNTMGLSVATGKFQAKMDVSIVNDGPVTFLLESRQ